MEFHWVSELFPEMDADDFDALVESIRENGQRADILTHEEKIVDGRHRYKACMKLGIAPRFTEWDGKGSLVALCLDLNLHHRHLSVSQRAMMGVRAMEAFKREAKERQAKTQFGANPAVSPNSGGPEEQEYIKAKERIKAAKTLGQRASAKDEETVRAYIVNGPQQGKAAALAAVKMGVGKTAIEEAALVLKKGAPVLAAAVRADQVAIHNAAAIATLPIEKQEQIVAAGPDAMVEAAKEIREEKKSKAPVKVAPGKSVASAGPAAVKKWLDDRVEYWAKSDSPKASICFEEAVLIRKGLCEIA